MPALHVVRETPLSRSMRVRQLEGMFDVPPSEKARMEWRVEADIDARDWNVGLITGPSGAGKSTIARELFGGELVDRTFEWNADAVIDDFPEDLGIEQISKVCQAVGFNTIPAWMRPFGVLSTGERFRVELARRLVEADELVVHDEFTSVVDRQVAKIGSHAVQKHVRRHKRRFVAVTCHEDVEDWLQPDWVLRPAEGEFVWRSVQPRPGLAVTVSPVDRSAWALFRRFHYMSSEVHKGARFVCLFVDDKPAALVAFVFRPGSNRTGTPLAGMSRIVTLPDYQGLGLAFVLSERVGSWFRAVGCRWHNYPAHPAYVRALDRSPHWLLLQKPGWHGINVKTRDFGGRPCARFRYVGPAADPAEAVRCLGFWPGAFWERTAEYRRAAEGAGSGS